jgi:hypothetical protein
MIAVSEIERVITELEMLKATCQPNVSMQTEIKDAYFDAGLNNAYECAIEKLKELIPSEASNPNRTDGNGQDHSRHDQEDQI